MCFICRLCTIYMLGDHRSLKSVLDPLQNGVRGIDEPSEVLCRNGKCS